MMGKGNEDLKAKIAKIQQRAKAVAPEAPVPVEEEPIQEEPSMESLEAEFEKKKNALMEKMKSKPVASSKAPAPIVDMPAEEDESLEQAITQYSNDGKFRVEVVFQLVQLNKNMKDIAEALKGLVSNDE